MVKGSKGIYMKPAIVIIAYNREKSLQRLLTSVAKADYSCKDIPLIISIDKSDNQKVIETANGFEWKWGSKKVIAHDTNLGLKKHVIECSSLSEKYGSVIVLEDDLYVARDFYDYAVAALEFVESNDKIAGVSLYNHLLNVHAREPFEAINDGCDGWYFQFASSWGQAFTRNQWKGFMQWMEANDEKDVKEPLSMGGRIPENVCNWGSRSWLKYYIRYMAEKDLYFLYPRVSRTTNFSEEGEHSMGQAADLQVGLKYGSNPAKYSFIELEKSMAVYDSYFENVYLRESLEAELGDAVTVDLYGKKCQEESVNDSSPKSRYILSSKALPYKAVHQYGRCLRPIDANIYEDIEGREFFLYDRSEASEPPKINETGRLLYNYRAFKAKYGIDIIKQRILEAVKN